MWRPLGVRRLGARPPAEGEAIFPLIDRALTGTCDVSRALAQLGVADINEFLVSALDQPDLRSRAVTRVDPARAHDRPQRIAADDEIPYHVRYLAQSRTGTPPTGDPTRSPSTY